MRKSYYCHEADPLVWLDIRLSGRDLLPRRELERYRDLIPGDEDLQNEWDAVVGDPEKYVSLLIGQKGDDEQRAESDEENHHDTSDAKQTTQNFFLAYHEVTAHLRFVASRPAEAVAYKRFQVSVLSSSGFLFPGACRELIYCSRCGTVSRWRRGMLRVIFWGMVRMGRSSQSGLWGTMMRVMTTVTVVVTVG